MLRHPLTRLLRRASEHRMAALAAFGLAAALQFWASRVTLSEPLPDAVETSGGQQLELQGRAAARLGYQGRGSMDVHFDRARLAPETAALLGRLGIAVTEEEGPISWVSTSDAPTASVLNVAPATAAERTLLRLRPLTTPTTDVARLELDADTGLRATLGSALVPGQTAARKLLRWHDREIRLDAALPIQVLLPPAVPMRLALPLASPDALQRFVLGTEGERRDEDLGAAFTRIGVRNASQPFTWFACAASPGALLWRGAGMLAGGACPPSDAASLHAGDLQLGAARLRLELEGSGWLWRDGAAAGANLLARVMANPALAVLLFAIDALLAGWLALALLSLRRRARYRVFLSYRRGDTAGHAGRLRDRLVENLGLGSVFMDVEDIPPGSYFERVLVQRIRDAESVLVVIGRDWLHASDAVGKRRLDDAQDFVRREVEMALEQNKRVIPILVGGAAMPTEADLPPSLCRLAGLNAVVLSDTHFNRDADALADVLDERVVQPGSPHVADA